MSTMKTLIIRNNMIYILSIEYGGFSEKVYLRVNYFPFPFEIFGFGQVLCNCYPLVRIGNNDKVLIIRKEYKYKYTQETLFIKKGKVKINFYDESKNFLEYRILNKGDVILLVSGGHDFLMLEDTEMIEVKQGPYEGDDDKERFKGK